MVISEETKLEYEKAQDSAEHYNTMTWTLIGVGIGFSLLLLKTIFFEIPTSYENNNWLLKNLALENLIIFLGISTITYFSYLIRGANEKKKFKYDLCKEIERKHKGFLGQNLGTKYLPITKKEFGITSFIITKYVLLIIFLGFGIAIFNNYTERFTINAWLVVGDIFLFGLNVYEDFLTKGKSISFTNVISEVKKEQNSYKNKNKS